MTIKDEILEELRNGTPLAEIRGKFRSQSQLYEAIRQFLEETDKNLEKRREKLEKVEKELRETEAKLQRFRREKKLVSKEIEELQKEKEKLTKEVTGRAEELDRLNADITQLQEKGFTSEILKKIKIIESRSGPELLSQVGTVEKYRQIKKGVSSLKKKKAGLERKIQALETQKKELEEEVVSEKNRLDELRLRTATVREAVAIVCSLFRDGYSTEDIESLKAGLDMLGIKGDPLLSVTRLVKGLTKQKSLIALQDRVVGARAELTTLKAALAATKAELKACGQLTKEVKDAGVKAIADTADQINKKLKEMQGKFDAHIQGTMAEVRTGLGEWGELQEQKGRLKEIIYPARILLGIQKSPEYLKQLPLATVFQLFDRLHCWSEMKMKDVFIRPSQDICRKDFNLNPLASYRLPVLIDFICEGLREIMTRQSRET